jgi:hypothetical protein
MIMCDNNRLHVKIKTTNILVQSYHELSALFIFVETVYKGTCRD